MLRRYIVRIGFRPQDGPDDRQYPLQVVEEVAVTTTAFDAGTAIEYVLRGIKTDYPRLADLRITRITTFDRGKYEPAGWLVG